MQQVLVLLTIAFGLAFGLDYKRVHLVETFAGPRGLNLLFRGNMPTNQTTFDYDTLKQFMAQRAKELNMTFPSNFYLIDLSLNNDFEGADFQREKEFWTKAPKDLGEFINWPLGLAGILPPNLYPEDVRRQMANSTVWEIDKIPERVVAVNNMLKQGRPDKPLVIFVHCTAGCDRTGEFIGSYRIQFQKSQTVPMFNANCAECGRCPNYWASTALEWYCYYFQYRYSVSIGDCMDFADCQMFGDCKSKHPNGTQSWTSSRLQSRAPPSPLFKLPDWIIGELGRR